jgi:hypothetical protein
MTEFSIDTINWFPLEGNENMAYTTGWCFIRERDHTSAVTSVRIWIKPRNHDEKPDQP